MGEMKLMEWVGSKMFFLLIVTVMIGTSPAAATGEYTGQLQELLSISNILLQGGSRGGGGGGGGAIYDSLSCQALHQPCVVTSAQLNCCAGSRCNTFNTGHAGICQWCPGRGESCGLAHVCCPGLRCNGVFNGRCS